MNACDNLNHSRGKVSIRYCPDCGSVLNSRVPPVSRCSTEKHNKLRKDGKVYCVGCGERLISNAAG